MTFDEVIQQVTANQGQSFTGIQLRADGNYLGIYTVSTSADDEDDPEEVHIHFEGGPLFADYGEEDAYSLDNAPDVVRLLTYQPTASLPDVGGLTPEYALHIFLPQLPDPEGIWSRNDRIRFTAVALVAAKASGCVTITAKDSSQAALSHVEPSRANADAHRNSGGARRKRHIPFVLERRRSGQGHGCRERQKMRMHLPRVQGCPDRCQRGGNPDSSFQTHRRAHLPQRI
ncbi:hypothetical protein SAMN04244572_02621 [Azotobacter beijerinckii]|uniref:Uncharacterized protein n=1 Tax=Azotobacter beijerinckii TaxID=170623 RepID=A0A1H6VPR9_9GAMM|nr:hypothetical protein SAMN04244572_02621 [Azotobacter beijerinckii]